MIVFKHQRKTIKILIICFIVLFGLINVPVVESSENSFFTIGATLVGNKENMDRFYLMQEQLAKIGIDFQQGHFCHTNCIYFQYLLGTSFDIGYVNLYTEDPVDALRHSAMGWSGYSNFYDIYGQNGSGNFVGYRTSMDFDNDLQTGKNEWYLNEYQKIFPYNSTERKQHFWEWQNYLMDKIVPCYPLITAKSNTFYWNELDGYNETKGMVQSWNDMSWTSLHEGQLNTNELIMIDQSWGNLNPINQSINDGSGKFVNELVLEPLVWFESDQNIYPHLANNFSFLNNTHLRIELRENIKWQNDTDNLFTDEYLDAEDVYFTYYTKKHLSNKKNTYQWIKDMKIIDKMTLDIFIDNDPDTLENNPNADIAYFLNELILPEHYLNQTQLIDGITPDYNHISWENFNEHCFGTGRFQIESIQPGFQTAFNISDSCWHLNSTLTSDPSLDWSNRFGSLPGSLERLVIDSYSYEIQEIAAFQNGEADLIKKPTWKNISSTLLESDDYNSQGGNHYSLGMYIFNLRESSNSKINSMEPCPEDSNMTVGLALRKAISYAINAEELINLAYPNVDMGTNYPIYEKMGMWCDPNIIKYDYNLTKAKEYMRLAGFAFPDETIIVGIDFPTSLIIILSEVAIIIGLRKHRRKKWVN